jgi:hypothetical protein
MSQENVELVRGRGSASTVGGVEMPGYFEMPRVWLVYRRESASEEILPIPD